MVVVKNSTHGNLTDFSELLAENYISIVVVANKEVEEDILGEIDPDEIRKIVNVLLLKFFN